MPSAGIALSWTILKLIDPIHLTGSSAETVLEMGFDPVIPMSFAPDLFYTQAFFVFLIAVVVFLFPLLKIYRLKRIGGRTIMKTLFYFIMEKHLEEARPQRRTAGCHHGRALGRRGYRRYDQRHDAATGKLPHRERNHPCSGA